MAESSRISDEGLSSLDACPAHIGPYEVIGQIGAGGMARAYLAVEGATSRKPRLVAVKLLRPEVMEEAELREMFRNEARVSVLLHHPNVVQTYEVSTHDQLFLVLEYLEGQSLGALYRQLARKDLSIPLQVYILSEVLAGLQHAHTLRDTNGAALDLVHRDVSPSNIFLTTSGEVKLLDFGIAKVAGSQTVTRAGIVKGKLGYAAPEQLVSASVDGRADVFAVGTLLWEALAARRRVVAETISAVTFARLQGHEQRIEEVAPATPKALRDICQRSTEVEPGKRYGSAEEMRGDLLRYLATQVPVSYRNQLGQLVSKTFEAELVARRRSISQHLRRAERSPLPNHLSVPVPTSFRKPLSSSGRPSSSSISPALWSIPPLSEQPRRSQLRALLIVAGACAASVGLVFAARSHAADELSLNIRHGVETLASAGANQDPAKTTDGTGVEERLALPINNAGLHNPAKAQLEQTKNAPQVANAMPHAVEGETRSKSASEPVQGVLSARRERLGRSTTDEARSVDVQRRREPQRSSDNPASAEPKEGRTERERTSEAERNADRPVAKERGNSESEPRGEPLRPQAPPVRAEAAPGDKLTRPAPRKAQRDIDETDPYSAKN